MSGLKYIGKSWIPHIPARDLTEAEVARYGRERLLNTGLYAELEDLSELTVSELKERAKEQGIEGYYSMLKAELIEALKE